MIDTLMHYPELPGLLLEMVFIDAVKPCGCVSWSGGGGINRTAWGTKLLLTAGLGLPCGLYQFMSLAEMLFKSEWVL